jgi:23S rRNA G2445 N2-methylase RlmL
MMKAFLVTERGAEHVAATDVKEMMDCETMERETVVMFDASREDLIRFAYRSQAVNRVLLLLSEVKVTTQLDETEAAIRKALTGIDAVKGKTFRVNCTRSGEQEYGSQDLAVTIGDIIVEMTGSKVSLESPEVIVHAHVWRDTCYIGIDLSGFDLGKRDYKVFTHPSSLTGITAYAALRITGYEAGMTLIDPFCGAGTIPIEAALFSSGRSPHSFKKDRFGLDGKDKIKPVKGISAFDYLLRYVIASKKNAAIAGVEKEMWISKVEVEWLDTKVEKGKAEIIVTHPPSPSRITGDKQVGKVYKEFLYQCDYVLKNKGAIGVILQNDRLFREVIEKDTRWKLIASHSIWQGSQEFRLLQVRRADAEEVRNEVSSA